MKTVLLTLLAAFTSACSLAAGTTYEYPGDDPFFTITFPDDWFLEEEDQSLSAFPQDESVILELVALESEEFDAAMDAVWEILDEEFDIQEIDEPQIGEMNEMDIAIVNAKGLIEGAAINISCAIFAPHSADTLFMLMYFGEPESLRAHQGSLNAIVQSIKSL